MAVCPWVQWQFFVILSLEYSVYMYKNSMFKFSILNQLTLYVSSNGGKILQLLRIVFKDVILKILLDFMILWFSAKNCDQMLRADAATTVCSRLMDPDPTGQLLFRSVDILWNMLENGDQGQLAEQLNNLSCIR